MPRSPSSIPARPIWRPTPGKRRLWWWRRGAPGVGFEHIRPRAVVDVGIHRKPEGGLCGDVRADEVEPMPQRFRGAGRGWADDVTMLLVNTVVACAGAIDHGLEDLIV